MSEGIIEYNRNENILRTQEELNVGDIFTFKSGETETKGFKIEASEKDKNLEIYVTDNDTGVRYHLPIAPEISGNYENFSADLNVNKIYVGSQIDYSVYSGVKYADIPFQTGVYYEKGKGVRKMQHELSIKDPKVKTSSEMTMHQFLLWVNLHL